MSNQRNGIVNPRIVGTRDSATSILRKLGVKPRDYNFFITSNGGIKLAVDVVAAQAHVQALTQPTNPAPEVKKVSLVAKSEKKISCSAAARDLILSGKTNEEVWTVIAEQFNLDAKKRGYPAWYRFQLRKAGNKV
jgi:hypothetical protein